MNENNTTTALLTPEQFDQLCFEVYRAGPRRMGLFAGGPDRHGILRHLTDELQDFKVLCCAGQRLHTTQATHLEVELDDLSDATFLRVKERLLERLEGFTLPERVPAALHAWLTVRRLRDDGRLLFTAADVLSDNEVSLSVLRFDLLDGQAYGKKLPKGSETLTGRVELPPWLDHLLLKERLQAAFPADTFVNLEVVQRPEALGPLGN